MAEESNQEGRQEVTSMVDQAIALLSSIQPKSEPRSVESGCSRSFSRVEGKYFLYICTVYWTWQIFSSNMKTIEMKRCGLYSSHIDKGVSS